jgi:3-hydroxyisobutyrate dehydrogenase
MTVIGFIGLGHMGCPMAANLVRAGHRVQGFDLAPAAMQAAREQGITAVASVAEAARGAGVVVTMLVAGRDVTSLYQGGLLDQAQPGTLFIDASTIDVASARAAHELAASRGMASIDAPVSGGVAGAQAATLTFMVGGDEAAVERARPLLERMGRRIVHCGGPGAGQSAKICNNMILGVSMIAICEAFVLAEKLGLSHQALFDVASTSSGECWALTHHCPVPGPVPASAANHDYRPGFAAALMLKDLTLAQEAAEATGADTALGRHAADIYRHFVAQSAEPIDYSAVIQSIRQSRGSPQDSSGNR